MTLPDVDIAVLTYGKLDVCSVGQIPRGCKAAGTHLFVSEATRERIQRMFQIGQSVVVPIAGKTGTHRLFEIVEQSPPATSDPRILE